jgi:hypothetical protein
VEYHERRASKALTAAECAQSRAWHLIEILSNVLGLKAQHETAILLQQLILACIPAIRLGVREVLRPIQLYGDSCIGTEQVDPERAACAECNRQSFVQPPAGKRGHSPIRTPQEMARTLEHDRFSCLAKGCGWGGADLSRDVTSFRCG